MSITTQDVKLYQSEALTDLPDGGGPMSANEVVDGELNNLFTDLSDLDRVLGRVSLRKAYLVVETDNRDIFLGANVIVVNAPEDDNVSVVTFTTNSFSDRRTDAVARVEQYLVAGPRSNMTLWDTQLSGQLTLSAYQRLEDPLPEVGETLVLSVEASGNSLNGTQQYVRVQNVEASVQTFIEGLGSSAVSFEKTVLTIEISTPLLYSFPGGDVARSPVNATSPTKVRKTNVSAGATYYGVTKLAEDIDPGDTVIRVDSILQPIIPSATSEQAILDQQLGADAAPAVAAGDTITQALYQPAAVGGSVVLQAPRGIFPASAVLTIGTSTNQGVFTDAGDGTMTRTGGGSGSVGTTAVVDYRTGQITLSDAPTFGANCSLVYKPAAYPNNVNHTQGEEITVSNRGRVRVASLDPLPAPGSVIVSFRALGVWYNLTDNGGGQLSGAAGTGVGSVNYATGSLAVTLGYEPDVGTHVLYAWGSGVHYGPVPEVDNVDIGYVLFVLPDGGAVPGSIVVSWTDGVTSRTAADNGSGGFTGDGTGEINYADNRVEFYPTILPASGTVFTLDYDAESVEVVTSPSTSVVGANTEFTLSPLPADGTVVIEAVYSLAGFGTAIPIQLVQTGPTFKITKVTDGPVYQGIAYGMTVGAYNAITGEVTLPNSIADFYRTQVYSTVGFATMWRGEAYAGNITDVTEARYIDDAGTGTPDSLVAAVEDLEVDLANNGFTIVPGSLLFWLNGRYLYDVGGTLRYRDVATGIEHDQGLVDYNTGTVTISAWAPGTRTVALYALRTKFGDWPLKEVIWRTTGAPIRNSSFILSYQEPGEAVDQATSDDDGEIDGPNILSATINYATGVYEIEFTSPVIPQTARYNAVAVSFLPLDKSIIGLDPVRLPLDGRIPIIRPANVLVIHNTKTTALTNPVSAATPYSLGRGALSYAIVRDADGELVPTDKYTTDLDVGEVEFGAPLDLTGYPQPLQVEHRIEDRVLCIDAQLSGDLEIFGEIGHAFDADDTYVSSALLFDRSDLEARFYNVFEQATWTGVWSDTLIGSASTGQYDTVNHPIVVTNAGAIRERWRLVFTNSNAVNVIGENTGQILSAVAIGTTIAPINPATGEPYFSIDTAGWGGGWIAGNVVRFNTDACGGSLWFLRCTLPGPVETPTDQFRVQLRGNAN